VKAITAKEITENYEVRSLLEALAARKGYDSKKKDYVAEMKKAFGLMKLAAEQGKPSEYWEFHQLFHDSYLKAADNQVLREILSNLRMHNAWYQTQFFSRDLKKDLLTHTDILRHFTKRDTTGKGIETAMKRHVHVGLDTFQKYMKDTKP
jgi:DNA-binding GntR family transcriptional regulator